MRMYRIHPRLQSYVQAVLDHQFGLERSPAVIINACSNKVVTTWEEEHNNEIIFELPFAGQHVRWQFSFNMEDFNSPPDILADDDFFESQTAEMVKEKVPSLGNWKPNDPYCLLNLVLELLELYQANQVSLLRSNERLHRYVFEYDTLVSMGIVNPSNLEVSVQHTGRGTNVEFFLQIDLDISELPLPEPEPPRPLAVLLVTYRTSGETSVEIHIWDDLEALIGRTTVPPLAADTNTLMDYVPSVQGVLQEKISVFVRNSQQRQNLFCAVAQLIEPAILDADSELYSKLTFLLKNGSEQSICCIELPFDFPLTLPLLSVQKVGDKVNYLTAFPFKSKWSFEKMAASLVAALFEAI